MERSGMKAAALFLVPVRVSAYVRTSTFQWQGCKGEGQYKVALRNLKSVGTAFGSIARKKRLTYRAMKKRRSVPLKIRALLQREVASACPFCDSSDVDHFEIHHIDDDPNNNDAANLMMLCPTCHSKITKGDIPSHAVRRKKLLLRNSTPKSATPSSQVNKFYGPIETAIVGDHNAITYKINTTQNRNTRQVVLVTIPSKLITSLI